MVSEIALRSIYALNPFFDDNSKGPLFNRYFDIIIVLDRPNVVESTIREYLFFSSKEGSQAEVMDILRTVGLEATISRLSDGLNTQLAATGWPLSITETMQLKLAAAIIARPRVLVLSQIFDVMLDGNMLASLDLLQASSETTVFYFSNKHTNLRYDHFLHLGHDGQTLFDGYEEFCVAAGIHHQAMGEVRGRPTAQPQA